MKALVCLCVHARACAHVHTHTIIFLYLHSVLSLCLQFLMPTTLAIQAIALAHTPYKVCAPCLLGDQKGIWYLCGPPLVYTYPSISHYLPPYPLIYLFYSPSSSNLLGREVGDKGER